MTLQEIEAKQLAGLPLNKKERRILAAGPNAPAEVDPMADTSDDHEVGDLVPSNKTPEELIAATFGKPRYTVGNPTVFGADDPKAKDLSRQLATVEVPILSLAGLGALKAKVYAKKNKASGKVRYEFNWFGSLNGNCLALDPDLEPAMEAYRHAAVTPGTGSYWQWAATQDAIGKPVTRKVAAHAVEATDADAAKLF